VVQLVRGRRSGRLCLAVLVGQPVLARLAVRDIRGLLAVLLGMACMAAATLARSSVAVCLECRSDLVHQVCPVGRSFRACRVDPEDQECSILRSCRQLDA